VPGPQGDPGEVGGSLLAAFWTFNPTTTAPPAVGQVRSNAGNTTLWVHKTDTDGFTRTAGLATVAVGNLVYVRAQNGTALNLSITAIADSGTYMTFTTTVVSGTLTKGARTQLNFVTTPPVGLPSGGTTDQVLGKTSSADYATSWRTLTAAAVGAQASDAELTAIAGLTSAADRVPYFTGSGTAALAAVTTAARTVLDDTTTAAMRATLGTSAIVAKSTTPVAADYGEATIPTNAIWVQTP
jgi:hypothetical protein